jgi:hypothetical protein
MKRAPQRPGRNVYGALRGVVSLKPQQCQLRMRAITAGWETD